MTNTQDALRVLQKFVDWNAKYPSSRIYSHDKIVSIAKELDEINAEAVAALFAPVAQPAAPEGWQPLTKQGQVKVGDALRFTIGDMRYGGFANLILHAGTEQEEIIYNKRRNYYLITSMAIQNKGSQKNVEFLSAIAPTPDASQPQGGEG